MNEDIRLVEFVRAALDGIGVTLQDESEYAEVALRYAIVVDGVRVWFAELPGDPDALVSRDLPLPDGWLR